MAAVGRCRQLARVLSVALIPLVVWGCGSQRESAQAKLCQRPGARQLIARTLAVPATRIATVPSIGNNARPQCSFKAVLPGGRRFAVTVNVDTSPQPYAVLSRTIEERQQVFSPTRLVPAPVGVMGLGLLASWFPDTKQLMSTDGVRLVTASVLWPGASQGAQQRFGVRISRLYLGRSRPELAKLFP